MPIHYDIAQTSSHLVTGARKFPRVVNPKTVNLARLARELHESTTLTTADIRATVHGLAQLLRQHLLEGENVHLDGIGYFHVNLDGEVYTTPEGRDRVKSPRVKNVLFLPEKSLKEELRLQARFELERGAARCSKSLSQEEMLGVIDRLLAENDGFTLDQFASAASLTRSTAARRLQSLVEAGVLRRDKRLRQLLFRRGMFMA